MSAGRRGVHDDVNDLTSGANAGVRAPNGSQVSRWATTTASSALRPNDDRLQSYFDRDYLPNQGELGDGVVDKVEVLAEFYNIVN